MPLSAETKKRFEAAQTVVQPLIDCRFLSPHGSSYIDNHLGRSYEQGRYLDAFARIFLFKPPCSAVCQALDTLFISLNGNDEANKKALLIMESCLDDPQAMLCVSASCYIPLHGADDWFGTSYKGFFEKFRGRMAHALFEPATRQKVLNEGIFQSKNLHSLILQNGSPHHRRALYRLHRDILKLSKRGYFGVKIFVLTENIDQAHAELALVSKAKSSDVKYIGISKLCCYLCHRILNDWGVDHRGTHGILYLKGFNVPSFVADEEAKELLYGIHQHVKSDRVAAGFRFEQNQLIYKTESEGPVVSEDDGEDSESAIFQCRKFKTLKDLRTANRGTKEYFV
jgi:hypothetical protein